MIDYRKGRFTSSNIYSLIPLGKRKMTQDDLKKHKEENPKSRITTIEDGFNAAGLTYIDEKNIEFLLQRSLSTSVYSRSIYWGFVMEKVLFEMLPSEYELITSDNVEHPNESLKHFWVGCSDFRIEGELISEVKCYGLKKFAQYTDMLMKQDIDLFKNFFSQEYWQIVSNSILYQVDIGEAISFIPYKDNLPGIRDMIENSDFIDTYDFQPWQIRFIIEDDIRNLNWIKKGGYYNDITSFRFIVPQSDKDYLTKRVIEASQLLVNK